MVMATLPCELSYVSHPQWACHDASRLLRLINDTRIDPFVSKEKVQEPNCAFLVVKYRSWPYIFIVSSTDIAFGAELCVDYGDAYWESLHIIANAEERNRRALALSIEVMASLQARSGLMDDSSLEVIEYLRARCSVGGDHVSRSRSTTAHGDGQVLPGGLANDPCRNTVASVATKKVVALGARDACHGRYAAQTCSELTASPKAFQCDDSSGYPTESSFVENQTGKKRYDPETDGRSDRLRKEACDMDVMKRSDVREQPADAGQLHADGHLAADSSG